MPPGCWGRKGEARILTVGRSRCARNASHESAPSEGSERLETFRKETSKSEFRGVELGPACSRNFLSQEGQGFLGGV